MNDKISIKKIVILIIFLVTILYILSFIFVIFNTIQLEKDKLKAISPRIIRILSNDILLGDQYSLNHTIHNLNSLYGLNSIVVKKEPVSCQLIELSCISIKTSLIEPEFNILIRGNTNFSKQIIYAFILIFIGLSIIFSILSYILFNKIKIPLENISQQLIPKLSKYIETGESIESIILNSTKEIEQIQLSLIDMAKALYSNIEVCNEIRTRSQVNEAIANSTKIFAHDVRKPFSILKIIIDNVENESDYNKLKLIIKNSIPFVNQTRLSVDNLISDVLELGSEAKINQELINPEFLIHTVLNEVFLIYPECKINLEYIFSHKFMINVDKYKILRVFSNIIYNALQTMKGKGTIWFKTNEIENNGILYTEFSIRNNGSFIPEESLTKIFNAYYTHNKIGGTGLGLAIAQKIIHTHKGSICCKSEKDDPNYGSYVEFIFTLPSSNVLIFTNEFLLPMSSNDTFWYRNKINENSK